jgi:chromosome segregation ATPase
MIILVGSLALGFVSIGLIFPNSVAGKFIWTAINALGMAGDKYKERNAIANYRAAVSSAGQEVGNMASTAGEYDALISSRKREREGLENKRDTLGVEIDVLQEEKSDDDPQIVSRATRLMQINNRIEAIGKDIEKYETSKSNLVNKLRTSVTTVTEGQRKAKELETDLKLSQDAARLASSEVAFNVDGSRDSMTQSERILLEQIEKNLGKASVISQISGTSDEDKQLQLKVEAKKAANFLAARREQKALPSS